MTRHTEPGFKVIPLETIHGTTAKREAPLPETAPAGGLIILRDGDPGDLSSLLLEIGHAQVLSPCRGQR